jgi:hypothetical protein
MASMNEDTTGWPPKFSPKAFFEEVAPGRGVPIEGGTKSDGRSLFPDYQKSIFIVGTSAPEHDHIKALM